MGGIVADVEINSDLSIKTKSNWKNTANGKTSVFFYEEAEQNMYDIPYGDCFVIVCKHLNNRGIAVAFTWANGHGASYIMTNRLHEKWSGWETPKLQQINTQIANIDKQLDNGRVAFKWNDTEGLELRVDGTYLGKVTLR